ncbi:MAG: MBL fold metallo-hydrolase [Syntrophomonadaceae bacterium]|nr:MBL fold metallo-hydrolase [Syntrophomonadaceae bacterium]
MLDLEEYDEVLSIRMSRRVLGREVSRSFVYLAGGLLIDTGPSKMGEELKRVLDQRELKLIVNTSCLPESIGNNSLLQRAYSVPVKAHKEAVFNIKHPRSRGLMPRLMWGQPLTSKVSKLKSSVHIQEFSFRVIETPSLRAGHICLFEPDRSWLFSGSLLACAETDRYQDAAGLIKDLKMIISLRPQVVYDSSNGLIGEGLPIFEAAIKSIENRTYPHSLPEVSIGNR